MSDQSNGPMPSAVQETPQAIGGTEVKDDMFVGEFAVMDLSNLRDKKYFVSIATGDPKQGKYLCSAIHGEYDFLEMVQEVGMMWSQQQHHARVLIAEKDSSKRVQFLNRNTVDYIEANWETIIAEGVFEDAIAAEQKEYTHTAGFDNVTSDSDPRLAEKKNELAEETEEGP